MSTIKQCDRCKKAYDPYINISNYDDESWRYGAIKDCYPYPEHKIDLCSDCRKKLVEWLKECEV